MGQHNAPAPGCQHCSSEMLWKKKKKVNPHTETSLSASRRQGLSTRLGADMVFIHRKARLSGADELFVMNSNHTALQPPHLRTAYITKLV